MPLTSEDTNMTQYGNTANIFTPILKFKVPAGVVVDFPALTRMVCKLYKSGGDEIDEKSQLYWAYRKSEYYVHPKQLTTAFRYRPFKNLALNEQRNKESNIVIEFTDEIKKYLAERGENSIAFTQDSIIELWIKSPDVVDWSEPSVVELTDVKVLE